MSDLAISQTTTPRWELAEELSRAAAYGFDGLAMWRPKLPDAGAVAAAAALAAAGVRATSLRAAGGFTGGDGRSFAEGVADAMEAVEEAAVLGGTAPPPVLVLHSGCRGGHTRAHAGRLLEDALGALVPVARREGVVLAIEPLHPAAAPGCSFVATLADALDVVARCDEPEVGLALDLWQFGDFPGLVPLLPRLAAAAVVVRVADRLGPPTALGDRLPAGRGGLPLEEIVAALVAHGFRGDLEFDPVGEEVESLGHDAALRETRRVADEWRTRLVPARTVHSRRAAAGSRRSQASSHTVSRG